MRAECRSATELELEALLRTSQRAVLLRDRVIAGLLAAFVAFALAYSVAMQAKIAELTNSLYWQTRAVDFYRDQVTRGCRQRDWVRPAVERAGRL